MNTILLIIIILGLLVVADLLWHYYQYRHKLKDIAEKNKTL